MLRKVHRQYIGKKDEIKKKTLKKENAKESFWTIFLFAYIQKKSIYLRKKNNYYNFSYYYCPWFTNVHNVEYEIKKNNNNKIVVPNLKTYIVPPWNLSVPGITK